MNSDTPRTDEAIASHKKAMTLRLQAGASRPDTVSADFARFLERELNKERKHSASLFKQLNELEDVVINGEDS